MQTRHQNKQLCGTGTCRTFGKQHRTQTPHDQTLTFHRAFGESEPSEKSAELIIVGGVIGMKSYCAYASLLICYDNKALPLSINQ